LHVKSIPGSPDLVLAKYNLVIFVHGCFWHRHEGCRYATRPSTDAAKWDKKFSENVARDERNIETLLTAGWRVCVLWECGLTKKNSVIDLALLATEIREGSWHFLELPKRS
jgi:DNA mismatch endonuclease (patch repair protein)